MPVREVIYLRAEQKYVAARTATHTYLLDESLINLEQELAQHSCVCTVTAWWRATRSRVL